MRLGLYYKNNAFLLRLDFTWRLFRAKRTICIQIQETKKYVFRNISNVSNLVAGACLLKLRFFQSPPRTGGRSNNLDGVRFDRFFLLLLIRPKCNNINHVWSHFCKILVVLKYLWANIFDTDICRSINIPKKTKYICTPL